MSGLLDFLQAASNSAASNVSGPVDGIAWLLRKAGIPVPDDPVGGSKWMEQKGLTRPVQQGAAQVLGETAGLLGPIAVAAKAPQVAKGLLQAGDNLAAPRTLNPQKGAIVWHGSPHKFDKFDSSKIGTGEGAQAYGHGLYLAESPDVAKSYADKLSAVTVDGRTFSTSDPNVARTMRIIARDPADARKFFDQAIAGSGDPTQVAEWKAAFQLADQSRLGLVKDPSLYKVDLPDPVIARMLDWDKPLSQQAPEVREALPALGKKTRGSAYGWRDDLPIGEAYRQIAGDLSDGFVIAEKKAARRDPVGKGAGAHEYVPDPRMGHYSSMLEAKAAAMRQLDPSLANATDEFAARHFDQQQRNGGYFKVQKLGANGGQRAAAALLKEAGIPGIRYLDGGSRGAGTGTSNFVVFPGEESLLTILERNGVPLR